MKPFLEKIRASGQCPNLKFPERGCARSASRSASKMRRLVFDTAALRQIRTLPAAVAVACCFLAAGARAQSPSALVSVKYATNFSSVTYFDPPHEQQVKARLSGAEAMPLPNALYDLKNMKVEEFNTDGKLAAEVRAPQCTYAILDHLASSPGHFEMRSGNGKLFTEGDGFSWLESEQSLVISNHVHTVIKIGITNLTIL